jgi:choline dehydrogenase-like flavoprotein
VDAWAQLGNEGWDWETLKPYYRKAYRLSLPSTEDVERLGLGYVDTQAAEESNGFIHASFPDKIYDPIADAWIQAFKKKELANLMTADPFEGRAYGGYINAASIDPVTKTRSYAANAYYEPVEKRENLQVLTGVTVEKVILSADVEGYVATGVQYQQDGVSKSVTARREVILSAGVFNSPKLLELSGIGSRTVLEKHSIPVLVDNPNVGENLQDHVLGGVSLEVRDSVPTKDSMMRREPAVIQAAMEDYAARQAGPFTVGGNYASALLPLDSDDSIDLSGLSESASEVYSRSIIENPHEPTAGYFVYPTQADFISSHKKGQGISTPMPGNYLTIAVQLLNPLSRGHSHIVSSNVSDAPAIDPRYLTHPLDVELLARHTRFIETIASSPSLTKVLKPSGKRSAGAASDFRAVPLDELRAYVRKAAKSTFHPMGTCSMKPRDRGGVVDARLRVWGVRRLRVVDASVIPFVTRANPQTSVYAIAERAADLVREDLSMW